VYSSVVLNCWHVVVRQSSVTFSTCKTETSYLGNNYPMVSILALNMYLSISLVLSLITLVTAGKWITQYLSLVIGESHSQNVLMLIQVGAMSEWPSFSRLYNIPLCACTAFCLWSHSLMDTWVGATSWLLWLVLVQKLCYYFFKILISTHTQK
jgi:hypothetical protein